MVQIKHKKTGEVLLEIPGDMLAGQKLAGAHLPEADFSRCDISRVDFRNADLRNANFRGAVGLLPFGRRQRRQLQRSQSASA